MEFNFIKVFRGNEKALPLPPLRGVTIDELGRIFSGGTSSWNRESELQQYGKSLYVFAAVNKIATKVASIELELYRITGLTGNDKQLFQHPVLDLVERPNPYQTRT